MVKHTERRTRRRAFITTLLISCVLPATVDCQAVPVAEWTVDPAPTLTIGAIDGPAPYLLTNPLAGMVFRDGSVVIRNSIRNLFELRYYDANGTYVTTASHWGRGPFEFHFPRGVFHLPGDSVLVVGEDGRFAVFGRRGEHLRDGRIDRPIRSLRYELIDTTHLGANGSLVTSSQANRNVYRDTTVFAIQGLDGLVDTLGILPAAMAYAERTDRGLVSRIVPFSPTASSAAGSGIYWLGRTDRPEIRGYDAAGRLRSTIRLDAIPIPITRQDRNRWRDEVDSFLSRIPDYDRRVTARAMVVPGVPDVFPFWASVDVDRSGNAWVRRYERSSATGPVYWDVFDRRGVPIAVAAVPREITPSCGPYGITCMDFLEIGEDYLLVVGRGEFDVLHVSKHRLIKN